MIIDQLPAALTVGSADELPIEKGQLTYKATVSQLVGNKVSKSGDTMTGNLTIEQASPGVYAKATDVTDGEAPSADTNQVGFRVVDKNGTKIAIFTDKEMTDGRQGAWIAGFQNGVVNSLFLYVDSSGNRSISVSDDAAWRSSLGLCYKTNDTMSITSSIALNGLVQDAAITKVYLDVAVEKSMENISSVSVTTMTGWIAGINGQINNTNSINFLGSGYTVTCTKQGTHHVRIYILKSSAFTNATAYTPVTYFGSLTLKFT